MSFFQLKMEWCWNRLDATFEGIDTSSKDDNATDEEASDKDIDDNASDNE